MAIIPSRMYLTFLSFIGSTRSPMASPRTSSLSLVRRRTRSMPPRSSTSAMRHGAGSSLARVPPRPPPTISPCTFHPFSNCYMTHLASCSVNTTLPDTPGYTTKNDQAYQSLPSDSRKPPAPIEPASTSLMPSSPLYTSSFTSNSQSPSGSTSRLLRYRPLSLRRCKKK